MSVWLHSSNIFKSYIQSYIHTIILVILLSTVCFGQASYDSVAAFTSKTTISLTDIFPFQTKVANKYTWRKITGTSMWDRITDTTEARITTLLNASNSWNGINNFDGATFNSGSHGKVIYADSVWQQTGSHYVNWMVPSTSPTGTVGTVGIPYYRMYSKGFVPMNPEGNDSCVISYDDSTLTFDKTIQAAEIKGLSTISHTDLVYSVPDVADSVDTVGYANVVLFSLPGANMTNLETIVMSDIPTGSAHIVIFKAQSSDPPYTVTLQDRDGTNSSDGNLELSGDFTLTEDDPIKLMYIEGEGVWYEISESDN